MRFSLIHISREQFDDLILLHSFYLLIVAPTTSIGFEAGNVSVNESDGYVTVNLVKTGNHSNNITVYISIMRINDSAVTQRMC